MLNHKLNRILAGLPLLTLLAITLTSVLPLRAGDEAEALYQKKCAMCHGKDGKADTKAGKMMKVPDLTVKENWKAGSDQASAEKIVREGAGKMPKFEGKLSDEEITAVTQHLRKLAGVE